MMRLENSEAIFIFFLKNLGFKNMKPERTINDELEFFLPESSDFEGTANDSGART